MRIGPFWRIKRLPFPQISGVIWAFLWNQYRKFVWIFGPIGVFLEKFGEWQPRQLLELKNEYFVQDPDASETVNTEVNSQIFHITPKNAS